MVKDVYSANHCTIINQHLLEVGVKRQEVSASKLSVDPWELSAGDTRKDLLEHSLQGNIVDILVKAARIVQLLGELIYVSKSINPYLNQAYHALRREPEPGVGIVLVRQSSVLCLKLGSQSGYLHGMANVWSREC